MSDPVEVLGNALAARGNDRRARAAVYLNRRARPGGRSGAWLSEVGFYADRPFAYAAADASNLLPAEDEPRQVTRIEIHLYGAARDYARLTSALAVDRAVRSTRAQGQSGRAPYPEVPDYLGAADLLDDTSVPEKTEALLGRMRTAGSGVAYHAVVTRAGAVYIPAPLDRACVTGDAPDVNAEVVVAVAIEGACYMPRDGTTPVDAPLTEAQMRSLAVVIAKVHAAHTGVSLAWGSGLRASAGIEGVASGVTQTWLERTESARADILARVTREGAYDVASEVFLRNTPPPSRRAEAQAALGTTDTLGRAALLLGAYADVAADDRAAAMQEPVRTRFFVERARAAHREAADAGAEAAHVAQAPTLAAPPPPATATAPFVYDYLTGRWGDQ